MKLTDKTCTPCAGDTLPLTKAQEDLLLPSVPEWSIDRAHDPHTLSRSLRFKNFTEAMIFVNKIAALAEAENHHPDIMISWNKVTLTLYTHAINGLSENDFILAAKVDNIL